LPPFFAEPQKPTLADRQVVLDAHRQHGADARKAVSHHTDQRAVAQADQG